MKKKILVLAAGILQIPVIKKAKSMGYYVIAADGNPNAVGFSYADKSICVNITDEETMLKVAIEQNIDGVIHPCSEVSMYVMGRINDELGLTGVTREQAVRATNKQLMREAFMRGNAPSPFSSCFNDAIKAWDEFHSKYKCDCILKPSRNSGSRGISKISTSICEDEFIRLFNISKEESRDSSVMLEQFIDGPEFSVEIIVWNHNVNVIAITDKKTTGAPNFVELGHSQPSCYPTEVLEKIQSAAIIGVQSLELNNCACHAELKFYNDNPYIMEIGARLGGDFISTELTHLSTGIDMVAAAINCALGIQPCLSQLEEKKGVCIRYFCPKPGKLIRIHNLEALDDSRVYMKNIYVKEGDMIPVVTSSTCRSGHIIVTEDEPKKAIELAERLISEVEFEIE